MTGLSIKVVGRYLLLVTCLLVTLTPKVAQSSPVIVDTRQLCGLDENFECQRKNVPDIVKSVCDACGQMWTDVGLSYCCRCDQYVFASCYEAVFGEPMG